VYGVRIGAAVEQAFAVLDAAARGPVAPFAPFLGQQDQTPFRGNDRTLRPVEGLEIVHTGCGHD